MSKRLLMLVLALALVIGFAAFAYAEVQNIKVSGDLLMQAITRNNFTLTRGDGAGAPGVGLGTPKYANAGFISHARIRVDADLTDNVSANVRLLNERSWGNDGSLSNGGPLRPANPDTTGDEVTIDLAYATLKEFFYAPLTVTVGRQELRFGSGLVVGDIDTNRLANEWQVPWDLSLRKSFDAARLTVNYDPIVVDAIYSKIEENDVWWLAVGPAVGPQVLEKKDTDLYGLNIRYDMAGIGFKGATELYAFSKVSKWNDGVLVVPATNEVGKTDTVNTLGFLTYGQIIKNLNASLEGAYQFGNDAGVWLLDPLKPYIPQNQVTSKRSAWALEITAAYDLKDMNTIGKYAPKVGAIYGLRSGDKTFAGNMNPSQRMWDPMFEDKTLNSVVDAIFPNTNVRYAALTGSCKPIEDVTLSGVWGYYLFDRTVANFIFPTTYGWGQYNINGNKHMGQALYLTATYDYTEDVQFGLTYGLFVPGKGIANMITGVGVPAVPFVNSTKTNDASQIIGSMKVTF